MVVITTIAPEVDDDDEGVMETDNDMMMIW
jgi:hypothetical protein